jgi:hypothetical protein
MKMETSELYPDSFYRNLLLNISIASARATEPIIVARRASSEQLKIRPTMHIFQITEFGETKSTLSDRIGEYCRATSHRFFGVSSLTAAAIAGSIDEKGHLMPPVSADFVGGTIVVDEFKTNAVEKSNAIGAALDVVESERSSRAISRRPTQKSMESLAKLRIRCEVGHSRIQFWGLRSNWIFLTAKHLQKNRELQTAMLISRTVPLYFSPSLNEINDIDDNPDLLFQSMYLEAPPMLTIPNKTYIEIRDHVQEFFEAFHIPTNYYLRTINDCVRTYVFGGYEHNWDVYDFILKQKAIFVSDYEKSGGSLAELEIYVENAIQASRSTSAAHN